MTLRGDVVHHLAMKPPKNDGQSRDRQGRIIYGSFVYKDLHPVPWLLAAAALWASSYVVPAIVTGFGALVFAVLLMRDLTALRRPDYDD